MGRFNDSRIAPDDQAPAGARAAGPTEWGGSQARAGEPPALPSRFKESYDSWPRTTPRSPCAHLLRLDRPLRDARFTPPAAEPLFTEPEVRTRESEAYARGRREGEAALGEQLLRQRAELVELQQGVIESLRQTGPQVARECEQALVALALEAAQKLVAGLPISVETVQAVVQEALAQVEEATEYHVHLHPDDMELLHTHNSALLQPPAGGGARIHFHRASDVSRGGCLVKTRFGVIDARRETKLELLRSSVLE
jgi:hypothetical protein